jgi:hypothetical protein
VVPQLTSLLRDSDVALADAFCYVQSEAVTLAAFAAVFTVEYFLQLLRRDAVRYWAMFSMMSRLSQ